MDVVIEVRDARIPMSTSHPQVRALSWSYGWGSFISWVDKYYAYNHELWLKTMHFSLQDEEVKMDAICNFYLVFLWTDGFMAW